jgi:hypothetical protein
MKGIQTMNYGKFGWVGIGLLAGIVLANLFGGSSATADKSNATAVCSQQAARDLVQRIVEKQWPAPNTRTNINWSTVGGRPDPRDSNVFICVASGVSIIKVQRSADPSDLGDKPGNVIVSYTVTLMGSQIQVQGRIDYN